MVGVASERLRRPHRQSRHGLLWSASQANALDRGPPGGRASEAGLGGEVLLAGAERDRLHELAVDGRVGLTRADPGDVVIAGAAVEGVHLAVGGQRVEDVVPVPAVLGVDAGAAPDQIAVGAAVYGVVALAAVESVRAVPAFDRVVAGGAPDHVAA